MPMQGLPPELQLEADQLHQRQKIADMLMQQGNTPFTPPTNPGRIASRASWLQPAAQMFSAFAGQKLGQDAAKSSAELGGRYESFLQQGVKDYMRQKSGTGVQPDPQEISQSQDYGTPPPPAAGPTSNPRDLAATAMLSRNPAVQALGKIDYEHEQKLDLPKEVPPGGSLFTGRGTPLVSQPPLHQIPADWQKAIPSDAIRLPNDPPGVFRMKGPDGQADVYSVEFEGGTAKGYKRLDNGPNPNAGSTLRKHYTLVHTAKGTVAVNDQDPNDIRQLNVGGAPVIQTNADPVLAGAKSAETAAGKAAGALTEQQRLALPKTIADAELGLAHVDQMIGSEDGMTVKPHPGFKSAVGFTFMPGMRHVHGSHESDFQERLKQLKGGAFLQAYNTLKGGGAITEIEGEKGTKALQRLDLAQSEDEFKTAAREFQQVLRAGVERAKVMAAQSPRAPTAVAPPPGFQPL